MLSYRRETRKYNSDQLLFILDGVLINASIILSTGIFVSGYIVFLGGSDFITGIINSSLAWASVASLFSFLIYEKLKRRKTFLIILAASSRFLVCSSVFLALFLKDRNVLLYGTCGMIIAGNVLWGIYAIGSMVWIVGISPKNTRNNYFYTRMLYLRIAFTFATIVMGFLLDFFNKSYTGFVIVFSTSLLLAVADIFILARIHEPQKHATETVLKFDYTMFWEPLRNKEYRNLLIFIMLFYISITMSSSFTPLYLIKYLNFNYGFISAVTVIMYIAMIVFTRFWNKIEYKKGFKYVFYTTSVFITAEFLVYAFLVSERYYLLFLSPILSGIGNSGFNICIMNYRYNIMPDKNQTVYEGWFNGIFGFSTFIAPIIGGILLDMLPTVENWLFRHSNFQLLYLISFILSGVIIIVFFRLKRDQFST